ncbi:MAG: hypothetical protein P4L69_17415 [Desulfosporosinus sp.]|nr:hypothetical protein [Desulfosporosinus sp.]
MFYGNEELVKSHVNKVDLAQERLFKAQLDLIKAYERQWAEMNYLVENGQWDGKPFYLANAYGIKVTDEMYVFQLSAPLPFLPNPYYTKFKKSREEFMTAKLLVSAQFRDVINQLDPEQMRQPAALLIKHHHDGTRSFDLDNKAKQVVINTIRQKLIADDNVKTLPLYYEEAIQGNENRTMLYLGPHAKWIYMETEIAKRYPRIDHLPGVIEGKYPGTFFPKCPSGKDKNLILDSGEAGDEGMDNINEWTIDNPFM